MELSIRPLVASRSVTRLWSSDREDVNGRNETAINLVSAKVNMGNHLSCDWPKFFNTRKEPIFEPAGPSSFGYVHTGNFILVQRGA